MMEFAMKQWASTLSMALRASSSSAPLLRVTRGRTVTSVVSLDGEERVAEMARMLGGARITEKTLEHAREMIEEARITDS